MFRSDCDHEETLVVSSVGVHRTVCEKCGHLSFEISPDLGRTQRSLSRGRLRKVS
jgi:hypothetical protein